MESSKNFSWTCQDVALPLRAKPQVVNSIKAGINYSTLTAKSTLVIYYIISATG